MISRRSERNMLFIFLVPAVLTVFVFTILPALWAIGVSFTDRALTGERAVTYGYVGISNYIRLFENETFRHSVSLTLWYTLWTNLGQFTIGMATALFLNRAKLWGKTFLLAVVVLPMVIPGVIQSLIWSSMLAMGEYGTLNRFMSLFGVEPIAWLREAPMLRPRKRSQRGHRSSTHRWCKPVANADPHTLAPYSLCHYVVVVA
jgi:multiple sugar transport system permease protein